MDKRFDGNEVVGRSDGMKVNSNFDGDVSSNGRKKTKGEELGLGRSDFGVRWRPLRGTETEARFSNGRPLSRASPPLERVKKLFSFPDSPNNRAAGDHHANVAVAARHRPGKAIPIQFQRANSGGIRWKRTPRRPGSGADRDSHRWMGSAPVRAKNLTKYSPERGESWRGLSWGLYRQGSASLGAGLLLIR